MGAGPGVGQTAMALGGRGELLSTPVAACYPNPQVAMDRQARPGKPMMRDYSGERRLRASTVQDLKAAITHDTWVKVMA
ncbi:MAG: hypothetical protein NVSMB65_21210 [Chloroflexota bacterium]